MKKKILIISYTFPPNQGIGGRRWAKFAKYLNRNGHQIHIITNVYNTEGNSNWVSDIDEYKDKIERINFGYPKALDGTPKTIIQKIRYRVALKFVQRKAKGNYYDRAIFAKEKLLKSIRKKLNEGYDNVIVTVAPFHIATCIGSLKNEFSDVNFIVDFRDPWIGNETAYGFHSLTKERKKYEIESEKLVVQSFDKVFSVADYMTNYFKESYLGENKGKFVTIMNGFDKEDFKSLKRSGKEDELQYKLIFIGTYYNNAGKYLAVLNTQLSYIKENDLNLYSKIRVSFYGSRNVNVNEILETHSNVKFHGPIAFDEAKKKLKEADIGLLFLSDDINFSLSTKFCEYLINELPIVVFGKKGETSGFIKENELGIGIFMDSEKRALYDFLSNYSVYKTKMKSFDKAVFDINNLSLEIEKYLK